MFGQVILDLVQVEQVGRWLVIARKRRLEIAPQILHLDRVSLAKLLNLRDRLGLQFLRFQVPRFSELLEFYSVLLLNLEVFPGMLVFQRNPQPSLCLRPNGLNLGE